MEQRQRGGLHEPVEPRAREAHVVSAADIVDPRFADLRKKCPGGLLALLEQIEGREDADPCHGREPGRGQGEAEAIGGEFVSPALVAGEGLIDRPAPGWPIPLQ
jgi:hypothetical protein